MSNELPNQFGMHVSRVLVVFQLIEESLKLYISFSFKLIRVKLDRSIPFGFSGVDYENAPLERLISVFEKLTDNALLVQSLSKIKNDRNYIAHQALVSYLKEQEDGNHHEKEIQKIDDIAVKAWACFRQLQEDLEALNTRIMGENGLHHSPRRAQ